MTAVARLEPKQVGFVKIERWRVVWKDGDLKLYGKMTGHPKFEEGEEAFSSRIVRVDGRKVYSSSGRCYKLGTPAPWSKIPG